MAPRKFILTNKVIRQASSRDECVARKLTFLKKRSCQDPANLMSLFL